MLNGVHVWIPNWPSHDLHILLCQKCSRITSSVERGIVLDVHNVSSKSACRPGKHTIVQKLDVASLVEGCRPWIGCMHLSVSPVDRGANEQTRTPGGTPRPKTSSQEPVYNGPKWQPPPKSAQTRRWYGTIDLDLSDRLSVSSLLPSLTYLDIDR